MQTALHVFIVDDEADYRFLTSQVFARFLPQYSVRFFASGDELQQHVLTNPSGQPALVVIDLHMPGLNGLQTLTYLKALPQWHRIPVIIMSNTTDQADIRACYEAGVNSFLTKPVGITQLHQIFDLVCRYWLTLNKLPEARASF